MDLKTFFKTLNASFFFYKVLLFFEQNVFLIFCFLSNFGTKRKHTGLTNSESAKDLVRISVLEEKLDL